MFNVSMYLAFVFMETSTTESENAKLPEVSSLYELGSLYEEESLNI